MELVFEDFVAAPPERVFTFHEHPGNLLRLLRCWPFFRLLGHEPRVRLGGVMWIEETFWRIPVALGFVHDCYEPPYRFGSRMFHGPFEHFAHEYTFARAGGGSIMRITLNVSVPWKLGGRWLLERCITPRLRRAFTLRQQELARLALAHEL